MLRMIFVFILTVSLTFLPAGGPAAFAAPDEPDEEVSVEAPAPELAGADDIDWVTEAEVLDTLKTLNDMQLNRISRDITVATVELVQVGPSGTQDFLGAVLAVAGFGAVIVGLKEWPYRREAFGTPSWVGWVIVGVAAVAVGVLTVKTSAEGATVERVTYRELREIVGEDVAQGLEYFQQWLARVDRALDQKQYIDIQLTPYDGQVYEVQELQPLQVDLYQEKGEVPLLRVALFPDDSDRGRQYHMVQTVELKDLPITSDDRGCWWVRLSPDNVSPDVFQRIKAYIKSRIFMESLLVSFTDRFLGARIERPTESPVDTLEKRLEATSFPIGPMDVRSNYSGQPLEADEDVAAGRGLSMADLLDETKPAIELWR